MSGETRSEAGGRVSTPRSGAAMPNTVPLLCWQNSLEVIVAALKRASNDLPRATIPHVSRKIKRETAFSSREPAALLAHINQNLLLDAAGGKPLGIIPEDAATEQEYFVDVECAETAYIAEVKRAEAVTEAYLRLLEGAVKRELTRFAQTHKNPGAMVVGKREIGERMVQRGIAGFVLHLVGSVRDSVAYALLSMKIPIASIESAFGIRLKNIVFPASDGEVKFEIEYVKGSPGNLLDQNAANLSHDLDAATLRLTRARQYVYLLSQFLEKLDARNYSPISPFPESLIC